MTKQWITLCEEWGGATQYLEHVNGSLYDDCEWLSRIILLIERWKRNECPIVIKISTDIPPQVSFILFSH
jgi:hypothetical protein